MELIRINFITIIDLLGTFTFALSGIRMASRNHMDWFGAYIIGLVTAIGGGTTRDLLLGATPFWMEDERYVITTGVALVVALIFKQRLFKFGNTLFLFDAIGLGLYTVVGIVKSDQAGFPFWVCIFMGAITGSVGGVIRDIIINEIPLLFRKDLYAIACIIGGCVFFACKQFQLHENVIELITASSIILIRIMAVRFHLQLPLLKILDVEDPAPPVK